MRTKFTLRQNKNTKTKTRKVLRGGSPTVNVQQVMKSVINLHNSIVNNIVNDIEMKLAVFGLVYAIGNILTNEVIMKELFNTINSLKQDPVISTPVLDLIARVSPALFDSDVMQFFQTLQSLKNIFYKEKVQNLLKEKFGYVYNFIQTPGVIDTLFNKANNLIVNVLSENEVNFHLNSLLLSLKSIAEHPSIPQIITQYKNVYMLGINTWTTTTTGNSTTTTGNSTTTTGNSTTTAGNSTTTAGNSTTTAGNSTTTRLPTTSLGPPAGSLGPPAGSLGPPAGSLGLSAGN